ncbi:MAG: hypothetical protein Q9208_002649 [Pyrenodesmia sp. 3 TL-2023]
MQNLQNYKRIIFVLGPPGAGKTYLCKRAAKELGGVQHLPMNDLLRREAARPLSPWAKDINSKLSTGRAVSSEATTPILKDFFDRNSFAKSKILLDDFPRNLDQVCRFEDEFGIAAAVIQLTGKREIMEKRLAALGKSDEEVQIARTRYQGYINETLPTIEYLRGVVSKVPADTDQDEVFKLFQTAVSVGRPPMPRESQQLT